MRRNCRYIASIVALLLALIAVPVNGQGEAGLERRTFWVDSMYRNLTPDERIGQLFMIRAHSNLGSDHVEQVRHEIETFHVGGLCFFQGTPQKQVQLTNTYQDLSRIPLLVAMDAEWGPGMRLKEEAMQYPRQLMLGAIQDNRLIYRMGSQVARQLRALGVHMNFAPVVDINNNPSNPVIHDRSFGEDKFSVAAKGYQYMKGLQDGHVLACAKHFPGHGDTDVDSHYDLPYVKHDIRRLDSLELYPFRVLIREGVAAVMVAHMALPAIDSTPDLPATLSTSITTGILRDRLAFDGLIITDAMEMQGLLKHHSAAEAAVMALQAGADILLLPGSTEKAFKAVQRAVKHGEITEERLEASVRRILAAKYDARLFSYTPADTTALDAAMINPGYQALHHTLIRESLTVVSNKNRRIPVTDIRDEDVVCLSIGVNDHTAFTSRLKDYLPNANFNFMSQQAIARESAQLIESLASREVVIIPMHGLSRTRSSGFGILPATRAFLKAVDEKTDVILLVFGTPYALEQLSFARHILLAYQDTDAIRDIAAQGLMGVFGMEGRLPVSVKPAFEMHWGENTQSLLRLGYGLPEEVGISSCGLHRIDSLVDEMFMENAAPGCQVLVARKGIIVFEKTYGYHSYHEKTPVKNSDIYDLASITKIAATTLAIMRLESEGKINIHNTIGYYLPELESTNKAGLLIRDILAHQAGLYPWIPFYRFTLSEGKYPHPLSQYYQDEKDDLFSVQVADNMYLRHDFIPQLWDSLTYSEINSPGKYRYSDLGFYLLAKLVHEVSGDSLHRYVAKTFYNPLNLKRLGYLPLERFNKEEIVPTEEDRYFRFQRVQGYVHDMGAAMLGGVGGHAGLFGNARDLAVVMQMLLNKGYYGGTQYLDPATVLAFTRRVEGSTRRGSGFDMKELNGYNGQPTAEECSPLTYGHLGFTGTCAWNDPKEDLVYIFLSNRTYPTMNNNILGKLDYRQKIQSIVYQSLISN